MRVLFVCTGNICRSPTAEGVLRELCRKEAVPLQVESRGTHDYHVGEPPDEPVERAKKSSEEDKNRPPDAPSLRRKPTPPNR